MLQKLAAKMDAIDQRLTDMGAPTCHARAGDLGRISEEAPSSPGSSHAPMLLEQMLGAGAVPATFTPVPETKEAKEKHSQSHQRRIRVPRRHAHGAM